MRWSELSIGLHLLLKELNENDNRNPYTISRWMKMDQDKGQKPLEEIAALEFYEAAMTFQYPYMTGLFRLFGAFFHTWCHESNSEYRKIWH